MHLRGSLGAMKEFISKNCVALAIGGGNSLWMMTPNGKVLEGGVSEKALTEFRRLPERERKPEKLVPLPIDYGKAITPPPGGLVARQYLRYLGRDARGELSRWKEGVQG